MGTSLFYITGAVMLSLMVQHSLSQIASLRAKQQADGRDRFNFFDRELLQSLARSQHGNLLFSPASVKAALAMTLEGAGGKSAKELRDALRLPDEEKAIRAQFKNFLNSLQVNNPSNKVEAANQIFLSHAITPQTQYERVLKNNYMSEIEKVDFSKPVDAAHAINRWVNMLTHGLIPSLVQPGTLSGSTKLMLVNAMYFKGKWKNSFDLDKTSVKCFYVEANQCLDTYFMESVNVYNYAYTSNLDAHAVELPYEGDQFSLLLLMPNKRNAVQQLIRDMTHVSLSSIVSSLQPTDILVSLPRFNIDYSSDIVQNLGELGIQEIFSTNANLTGMVQWGSPDLHISNILHKAKIEVNEEGTTAAAATGTLVVPLMGTTLAKLIFNHPFLFFLRNTQTGDILFAGCLAEPEAAKQPILGKPNESQLSELSQGIFTPKPPASSSLNPGSSVSNTFKPSVPGSNTNNLSPSGSNTYNPVPSGSNTYNPVPSGSNTYNPVPSGSNTYNPVPSGSNTYNATAPRLPIPQNNPNLNNYSPKNLNIENASASSRFLSSVQQRSTENNAQLQPNIVQNTNTATYLTRQHTSNPDSIVAQYAPVPTQYFSRAGSYAYATNTAQYASAMNETPQGTNGLRNTNQSYNDRIHFSS